MTDSEKQLVIEALQYYINNKEKITYDLLRQMSDLKERLKAEIIRSK